MSDPLAGWWVHELQIKRKISSGGGYGDQLADPVPVTGFYDDSTQLMAGPNGVEVVVSGRFAFPADVAYVPVGSFAVLPEKFGGREAEVVASAVGDAGGQPVPAHQEIGLK